MRASAFKFSQKVLGEGGVRAVAALFILLLARRLGAHEFGRYSTAVAYAAICIVFVDMGTNSVIIRELARRPGDRIHIAKASHAIKVSSGILSWLLLGVLTLVLHFDAHARFLTLMIGIVVMGQAMTDYFSALLNGIEEMGWEAMLKVLSRGLTAGVGLVLLLMGKPLPMIVMGLAGGTLVGYAASWLVIRNRFSTFGFSLDWDFIQSLFKSALPLFVSVVFWILYESQDILILNAFHLPSSEVGYFSAAIKIIDVLRVFPVLVTGVVFPSLSRLHATDALAYRAKRKKLTLFLTTSLLLMSVTLYFAALPLIQALYHADYLPSVPLLRTLAWSLLFSGLNYASMQLLITTNRERLLLPCALIACGANLVIAVLLVPPFGALGTCYALVVSEVCTFIFLRKAIRD